MRLILASAALTFLLGICSAWSPRLLQSDLDIDINEVKKMILEYDPEIRERIYEIPKTAEDLALRMFQHGIDMVENQPTDRAGDPIPAVAAKLNLTTLVAAVVKAGLKDVLESAGPFTVFGPTNDAFANLPDWAKKAINDTKVLADILKYHVISGVVKSSDLKNDLLAPTVQGKKLRINIYGSAVSNDQVITAQCAPIDLSQVDQIASNGVIHVLKSVMLPPPGTIVEALSACPAFKDLVIAVKAAGLVETLSGPGPFTVFAPTDRAFKKLPPGTLEKLLHNPKELAKVLTYHVVPGTFCSAGLSSGSVKTVEGQDVKVVVSSGSVEVNNAKVISADGSVTNGVVHAIDTVLLPPSFQLP